MPKSLAKQIYISVGSNGTPDQEAFLAAVQAFVVSQGLTPITLGRNYFRNQRPLESVKDCMRECSGVIMIAFERVYIEAGIERRGSSRQSDLSNVGLTTVWNHIEAAMAYSLGLPLFILMQDGLRTEGLLEGSYDWSVQRVSLAPSVVSAPDFIGIFNDWKDQCLSTQEGGANSPANQEFSPDSLTVGKLFQNLKIAQLWTVIAAAASLLVAAAGIAFKLGTLAAHGAAK